MQRSAFALLSALALMQAAPVAAQSDSSYSGSTLTVGYGSLANCRPAVTSAMARAGGASVSIRLDDSIRQNITTRVDVTVTQGNQSSRFSGGGNFPTGSGTIAAGGDRLPTNLAGSRMAVTVAYCQVNAPVAPPPSGDR